MFQKKIIDKYIGQIEQETLDTAFFAFRGIFADSEKQANIRASKEEQYQEGFIRDLFCSVLGYTIKPEAGYNILTELKNETTDKNNSQKSDGAIVIDGLVKAVIELKGTKTTDLDRVAFQAFSYKNHHEKCPYVIVSNFERLRFYLETQIEYEEFNLFTLTRERFALLYLLLSLGSVTSDIPLKLKEESVCEEKEITNNFYRDYSNFKRSLFADICERNNALDKLTYFKKTQKLLDRILFILFCEDRGVLPANSIVGIIKDWTQLKKIGYPQPLYALFKKFFEKINKGFVDDDDHSRDVFAYNGGLFKSDEVLDAILVGDEVLKKYSEILAEYDFESQISVDILGRIFENSLTEIEEVESELRGKNLEPSTGANIGKRKKDGVFYTPEYITHYIVENTVGELCKQKKTELGLSDEAIIEYATKKQKRKKQDTSQKTPDELLGDYREWLLSLKILDPACGSGAFLNATLKYLRSEHERLGDYWARLHPGELYFENIDNAILENNLFGVDINEESVEIAKLSLWLGTAKKNRKLSALGGNIKCGNSLIDDKNVAGEKAFDWKNEFSEVFGEKEKEVSDKLTRGLSPLSNNKSPLLNNKSPLLNNKSPLPNNKSPLPNNKSPLLNNKSPLLVQGNLLPEILRQPLSCVDFTKEHVFHITTATHNSRPSNRPQALEWNYEAALKLSLDAELFITHIVAQIVEEQQYKVLAYNICCDHIHILLACQKDELPTVMQRIKGRTSFEYNKWNNANSAEAFHLWTQKYGSKEIFSYEQLENAVHYISYNREKHELPPLFATEVTRGQTEVTRGHTEVTRGHTEVTRGHTEVTRGLSPLLNSKSPLSQENRENPFSNGGFDVIIGNPPYVNINKPIRIVR